MTSRGYLFLLFLTLGTAFSCREQKQTPFSFAENEQGVELSENGKPVFFYQREKKSLTGRYVCNNYLHPLYSISGDTLTEEFPEDHPYHRGIFWAWHQLYINNKKVGDGWVLDSISQDVTGVRSRTGKSFAWLMVDVDWKSSVWQNGKPFIHENTVIKVYPLENGLRIMDFQINIRALIPDVSIGGSQDEKGYGGFCARIKLPPDLVFTSENGPVTPRTLQIEAGPWMDFTGTFSANGNRSGLTILCSDATPNFPAPWILRQAASMQNIVFPGRDRIAMKVNQPVILRYRLVVHEGGPETMDPARLQEDYNRKEKF